MTPTAPPRMMAAATTNTSRSITTAPRMLGGVVGSLADGLGRLDGGIGGDHDGMLDLARRPRRGAELDALALLRRADAVPQLARPGHLALVGRGPGRRRGPHPGRGRLVLARRPVLPWELAGPALVVDQQLVLGVDGVVAVGEGELEQLRLGDGLGGAGLDAQVAVDAAEEVDLVDEPVALTRRHRIVRRVVGAPHIDASGRADAGAQLAADALLHAVLVAVEDVAAVEAHRLGPLLLGILGGDDLARVAAVEQLLERDRETFEVAHQTRNLLELAGRAAPVRIDMASSTPAADQHDRRRRPRPPDRCSSPGRRPTGARR